MTNELDLLRHWRDPVPNPKAVGIAARKNTQEQSATSSKSCWKTMGDKIPAGFQGKYEQHKKGKTVPAMPIVEGKEFEETMVWTCIPCKSE